MVINFHTHIFADKIAQRAVKSLEDKGKIKAFLNGTEAELLKDMERTGVDISIVLPVLTKPSQVWVVNEWALGLNKRLISFAGLHPDDPDAVENIEKIAQMGFKGIKMHPDYQSFFVDDKHMYDIYGKIAEKGLVLMLHSGVDIGFDPPYHCTPQRLAKVLSDFPDMTVVAAHFGGHKMWDETEEYLVGKNVYLDTSMGTQYYSREQFVRIVKNHGSDKILFASDSPWSDTGTEIENIKNMPISDEDKENIFYKNAIRLLNI